MAIEKMKKLRLLAVRDQKKALLRKLMLLGCIEVSEPELSELSPELCVDITYLGDPTPGDPAEVIAVAIRVVPDEDVPPVQRSFRRWNCLISMCRKKVSFCRQNRRPR